MMKAKIFSAVMGITSLLATSHAYAIVTVSNCKITQIDGRIWEGSFDFDSYYDVKFLMNTVYFGIVLPNAQGQIGGQSTPTVAPTPLTPADVTITSNISNLVTIGASFLASNDNLRISQSNNNANNAVMFRGSGTVKVRLNLDVKDLYPALKITALELNADSPKTYSYEQWAYAIPGRTTGCLNGTGPSITVPPIEDLKEPDPKFALSTAQWMLDTADVGDLPDISVSGNGYAATINNLASNNLCMNYLTDKVKDKSYALSVSNGYSSQGGRNLFALNGSNGSQLLYNLQLVSNDGVTGNNFNFPATAANYITLSQLPSSVDKRSEMCWTPKINLFKNATTQAGMHTDTLNFMVTPKA